MRRVPVFSSNQALIIYLLYNLAVIAWAYWYIKRRPRE